MELKNAFMVFSSVKCSKEGGANKSKHVMQNDVRHIRAAILNQAGHSSYGCVGFRKNHYEQVYNFELLDKHAT